MSFSKYASYKDSGLDWIGMVPSHWGGPTALGSVSSLKGRLGWQGLKAEEYREEGPYVVSSAHFSEFKIRWGECPRVSEERYEIDNNIQLCENDILLMKDGAAMGKLAFVNEMPGKACLNSHLLLFRPRFLNDATPAYLPKFAFYYMQTSLFQEYIKVNGTGATFLGISQEAISRYRIVWPDLAEQNSISNFLDVETAKIDALIAEQEKLITLLLEKRKATIVHAVIRGINPNALMKYSGAAWLGQIPAHWETYSTKRLFRLVAEAAPDNNDEELLSIYTDIGVRPRKSLEAKGNKATTTDGYWIVRKGDIIVNKLLAWMGAIGLSNYDGVTSPAYDILRNIKPLNAKYYDYLFRCGVMFTEFKRNSRGIMDMRLRLYFEDFGQIQIPYPSEREQSEIVDFLESETAKLDALKAEAQHAIVLLKERRSALVVAAVTGQIDVRDTMTQPTLSAEAIAA